MIGTDSARNQPRLVIIAGPNGSGKTTLTDALRARGIDFGTYVNPDEIARDLALDGRSQSDLERKAQRLAKERRQSLLDEGRSLAYETVMSHPSHLDFIRAAKRRGYYVLLLFVGVSDPAINVARVAQRVQLGGHDVPTDRIAARYGRVMGLLPEAVALADQSLVFDNSAVRGPPRAVVAVANRRVAILVEDGPSWVRHRLLDRIANDQRSR